MRFNPHALLLSAFLALAGAQTAVPDWISTAQAAEDVPFLLTASAKGDLATVRAMLESGVNPNIRDGEGVTRADVCRA